MPASQHLIGANTASAATVAALTFSNHSHDSRFPNVTPRLAIGVASIAAACLLLAACEKAPQAGPGGPGGQMPPPEVNIVKIEAKDLPQVYEYVAQAAGSNEADIRARITGVLQERKYIEGSRVNKNDVLFEIDPGTIATQKANAEAAQAVSQARFNQAQREFDRLTPLIKENAISKKEYDDAKSNMEIAKASLQQAQAQVHEASVNFDYTKIRAPFTGVVGAATKSVGNLVSPTDGLVTTMVQTDPMYVNFNITEADYLKLQKEVTQNKIKLPGQRMNNGSLPFEVKLKLADGSIFPQVGKMSFASEKINPSTASIEARAIVANPNGALRPGQFVRVQLQGAQRAAAITVPQRAVVDGPMGKMVFVVTPDNKLAPRPVELDAWTGGAWIVTKGLQDGDQVMVDGFIKAHNPGMPVKPVLLSMEQANNPTPHGAPGAQGAPNGAPASAPAASATSAASAASAAGAASANSAASAKPAASAK